MLARTSPVRLMRMEITFNLKRSLITRRVLALLPALTLCGVLLGLLTSSAFATQNGEDVRQRELLQMIFDTEQSKTGKHWLQAVEQFDAAWDSA